ncbi:MAG: winged helix-turn-helix domain-containing protein [Burkholderiales bacterium]|jgi:ArsR family transcriptional regulator|nr:winged helix-turn-helix domain-containing protein [Burkholderiales bacterium]
MKDSNAQTAFLALGQESRLKIFQLIVQAGDDGLTPADLIAQLAIPNATLSFHLKTLADASLLRVERKSRQLIYRPQLETVRQLAYFLQNEITKKSY